MEEKLSGTPLEPDITGPAGQAWQHRLDDIRRKWARPGQQDASVASWVVRAPWANIMWHSYWLSVIHLRDIGKPTKIYLQGATHELWLYALDPGWKFGMGEARGDVPPRFLRPMNFAAQFTVPSDAAAEAVLHACVLDIVQGKLSPDTDYTRQWVARFGDNMVKPQHRATAGETRVVMVRGCHKEELLFDPKPADAVPACCHGVRAGERCAKCEACWKDTWDR